MKSLDSYKKEIKKRISLMIIFCSVALIIMLICNFYLKGRLKIDSRLVDYTIGFFTGLEIVCAFYIGMLKRTYYNAEMLQKRYLKEIDEREILIRTKSGANIIPFLSMIIVIISFVVVYFNYSAFVTLQAVAMFQMVICFLLKMYWKQKM